MLGNTSARRAENIDSHDTRTDAYIGERFTRMLGYAVEVERGREQRPDNCDVQPVIARDHGVRVSAVVG